MSEHDNVFSRLLRGSEEVLSQLSAELMSNPQFARAVQQALRGKQFLDDAATRALERANIPSRSEFKRAQRRVQALAEELAELRSRLEKMEKGARTTRAAGAKRPSAAKKKKKTG